MPRRPRFAPGGWIFHVLNRANARTQLFHSPGEYDEFVRLVSKCAAIDEMRILAWCLMPNHWHFLLWPREDYDLIRFIQRLTIRHTQHSHIREDTIGRGVLYQGRYKSSAVQDDTHLLTVCRYIERNPVRASLVSHATDWRWSSARDRIDGRFGAGSRASTKALLDLEPMPIESPQDWRRSLGEPHEEDEISRLRSQLATGLPFGNQDWTATACESLKLQTRRRGRPRKDARDDSTRASRSNLGHPAKRNEK
jgi:putative transposase